VRVLCGDGAVCDAVCGGGVGVWIENRMCWSCRMKGGESFTAEFAEGAEEDGEGEVSADCADDTD
jgi:hypothetical protein